MATGQVQMKSRSKQPPQPEKTYSDPAAADRQILIDDLLQALTYLDSESLEDVHRAYLFSEKAHAGQERQSGEAYIHHPLAVALILADIHLDSRSIIAAILHDVIEDTKTGRVQLVEEFGKDVANLGDGVTKIGQIEFESS